MGNTLHDTGTQQLQFLTTKEVADLLRVKERKVYDLAAANEIPHRRITGKLLFPAAELRSWIEGPTAAATPERPGVWPDHTTPCWTGRFMLPVADWPCCATAARTV